MSKLKIFSRVIGVGAGFLLVLGIVLANTFPFKVTSQYSSADTTVISHLYPASRAEYRPGSSIVTLKDDLAYFTTQFKLNYDLAKMKIQFKNDNPDQQLEIGYQDQESWHYHTVGLSAPFLDNLSWQKVGNGPYLYQKAGTYKSLNEFLNNPPTDKAIGIYDYDASGMQQSEVKMTDYHPVQKDTTIDVPLRGKTTLYAYLENEKFKLKITKQDLNWYNDPDPMKITVFKGTKPVLTETIDDDGNTSNNRHAGARQVIELSNPGSDNPEPGVYKIVFDSSKDSAITKLTTNLHKLVFEGPLYPIENAEVYGKLVDRTRPTQLYTSSSIVTLKTEHQSKQVVTAGATKTQISQSGYPIDMAVPEDSVINLPESNLILNGGYFAFTKDELFSPTKYKIRQVEGSQELNNVDYLITNYQTPTKTSDGWLTAERSFDLRDAVTKKNKLTWIVNASDLKENNRKIEIKNIEMTMIKKGWFDR